MFKSKHSTVEVYCRIYYCTFCLLMKCYAAQAGSELVIFLPHYPGCGESRYMLPSPSLKQGPLPLLYYQNKLLSWENMIPRLVLFLLL